MMVSALPVPLVVSNMRRAWTNKESVHRVKHYLQLAESNVFGLLPLAYIIGVHLRIENLKHMLETIAHNSLFNRQTKYNKAVKIIIICFPKILLSRLQITMATLLDIF